MKTITIKVDDKYAGVISATFIGLKSTLHICNKHGRMIYDGMVINRR